MQESTLTQFLTNSGASHILSGPDWIAKANAQAKSCEGLTAILMNEIEGLDNDVTYELPKSLNSKQLEIAMEETAFCIHTTGTTGG